MSRTRLFVRDDQTEVEVDYSISGGSAASGTFGPPEDYDPGSAFEVEVEHCYLWAHRNNTKVPPAVTLTDAEIERLTQEVNEDPETWAPDDEPWE